jgi:hypothetical protein
MTGRTARIAGQAGFQYRQYDEKATLEGLMGWQDSQDFRTTENPGWQDKPGGKIARMLEQDNQIGRPARMTG